jgi:HSP20 family protein
MFVLPVNRQSLDTRHFARLLGGNLDALFAGDEDAARSPALDVAEADTAYTVKLEMPGVSKEDVKVSVEGKRITVQAQTTAANPVAEAASERVIYRERAVQRYQRSFSLPLEVNQSDAGAKLENGVLTLTLPKRAQHVAAQVTVN